MKPEMLLVFGCCGLLLSGMPWRGSEVYSWQSLVHSLHGCACARQEQKPQQGQQPTLKPTACSE
eukprot:1489039-Amphidinium_carterae.1